MKGLETKVQQNLQMFLCDVCGYSKEQPGICPYCETPLTQYTKEEQREYQIDMEDAMRAQSFMKWYV